MEYHTARKQPFPFWGVSFSPSRKSGTPGSNINADPEAHKCWSWLPQVPVTSSCPLGSHTRAICTFIQVMGVSSRPPPATLLFPSYLFLLEYLSVSEQSRGPAATTTAVPMGLCLCTFTCRLCTLWSSASGTTLERQRRCKYISISFLKYNGISQRLFH